MSSWSSHGRAAAVALTLAIAAPAHAGGLWIGDNGAQALQRAGAFCARADDGTAIAYNPAGLMSLRRYEAYLGGGAIYMSQSYQRAGSYPQQPVATQPAYVGAPYAEVSSTRTQIVPFIAGAARFGRFALALGAFWAHLRRIPDRRRRPEPLVAVRRAARRWQERMVVRQERMEASRRGAPRMAAGHHAIQRSTWADLVGDRPRERVRLKHE